jgi:transmembrane sensor
MHRDASDPVITQAAAEWVARRDRGLTPLEARAFAAWRAADWRHDIELERLTGTWRELDSLGAAPELEVMANSFLKRARSNHRRRRIGLAASIAFAAGFAVLAGIITSNRDFSNASGGSSSLAKDSYRVLASTMQRTTLPDGSLAELNGTSRIEIDFTATERRVRLIEGEAHFVVEKNADRPFFVTAGPVTVRAVGTAFNVRLAKATIEVLVTEGKVKLEEVETAAAPAPDVNRTDASLIQGQRAVIKVASTTAVADAAIHEVNPGEITDALGWQTTRLVFNNTPLDEVVAGFNRFNTHRLMLGDATLRNRTLTGVFRSDNLDGFVRLLRASVDVKAELRAPSETVLLPVR